MKHNSYSSQLLTFKLPLDKVKCIMGFHVYDMDGRDPTANGTQNTQITKLGVSLSQTVARCRMSGSLVTSKEFSKCKAPKKLAFIHREVTLSILFETQKIKE